MLTQRKPRLNCLKFCEYEGKEWGVLASVKYFLAIILLFFFYCIKLLKQHNSEGKLHHSEGLEIG